MKQSGEIQMVYAISSMVDSRSEVQIKDRLGVEALAAVKMNIYVFFVAALERNKYQSNAKKFEYMKQHESPPTQISIEEAP